LRRKRKGLVDSPKEISGNMYPSLRSGFQKKLRVGISEKVPENPRAAHAALVFCFG
jgi:hypothetical protein